MSPMQELIAQCREDREFLQGQIDLMESGTLRFHSKNAELEWVDATLDLIESYKNQITQLDALIARHPEAE